MWTMHLRDYKIIVVIFIQVLAAFSEFVKEPPPQITAISGSTLKFDWLLALTDVADLIKWERNDYVIAISQKSSNTYSTDINKEYQDRITVASTGTLEIRGLTLQDEGNIKCTVTLNNGVNVVSSTELTVAVLPTFTTNPPASAERREGGQILFTCDVRSKPLSIIKWYQNDALLQSSDRLFITSISSITNKITDNKSTLNVTNIRRTDGGVYKCLAEHVSGNQEVMSQLTIYYPPTILNFPPSAAATVEFATNFDLLCQVQSNPTATVRWYKGVEEITKTNPRFILKNETTLIYQTYNTILSFVRIEKDDFGNYTCTAENEVPGVGIQKVEKSTTVVVTHNPYFLAKPADELMYDLGETIILNCTVQAYTKPTVTWTTTAVPTERLIQRAPEFLLQTQGRNIVQRLLEITTITKEDYGTYICTGNDGTHVNMSNTTISIRYAPVLLQTPLSSQIVAENSVEFLACTVQSYPTSTLQWFYSVTGDLFTSVSAEQVTKNELSTNSYDKRIEGRLNFRNNKISRNEEGIYECRAANSKGFTKSTVNITVQWAPEFQLPSTDNETYSVKKGSDLFFSCIAASKPIASITWRKNNLDIISTPASNAIFENSTTKIAESVLTMVNLQSLDAGRYVCEARNKIAGIVTSVQRQLTVIVKYPPEILTQNTTREVDVYGQMTLECRNRAVPPVTRYEWKKNDNVIENNQVDLIFLKIQKEDEGTYTCTPYNVEGKGETVSHTITIRVTPTFTHQPNCSENEMKLYCRCTGVGLPLPDVKWKIDESDTILSNETILNISVSQLEYGKLLCVLTNTHGAISLEATGVVTEPVTQWGSWSVCNASCDGYRSRQRGCNFLKCFHILTEYQSCIEKCAQVGKQEEPWHKDWYIALWILAVLIIILFIFCVLWCTRRRRDTSNKAYLVSVNPDISHSQPPSLRSLQTKRNIFLPQTSAMSAINKGYDDEHPVPNKQAHDTDTIEIEMQFGNEVENEADHRYNITSKAGPRNRNDITHSDRKTGDGSDGSNSIQETDLNFLQNTYNYNDTYNDTYNDNSFLQFYDDLGGPSKPPRSLAASSFILEESDGENYDAGQENQVYVDDDDTESFTFNKRNDFA